LAQTSAVEAPNTPSLLGNESTIDAQHSERFDVLKVDRTQFSETQVQVGQTATFPTYTEELLRVQWRRHDSIDVSLIKPAGIKKPPVVIFLYGYGTDPEKFLSQKFCETVASKGFAAVGFQSALTGPRFHDRPLKQWFVSELQESIGASVHDVQLMIDYLEKRPDLDTSRIGIFGQGSGGAISILAAAVDPRIKAIDVMDPWGDWQDWLALSPVVPDDERAGLTSAAFLEKVQSVEPMVLMHQLEGRPFRLQEALFDSAVPEAARKKIEEALPRNGILVHYIDMADYAAKVSQNGRMLDWLQTQLSRDPPVSLLN
jgi:cephalosporin-C deacetylase-like acetyl esterase